MFKTKVVLDSISPAGIRLVSIEVTYPRFIHSEMMTHRMFARNSASSRAIPWKKLGAKALPIAEIPAGGKVIGKGQFAEISLNPNETYDYYVPNCMYSMVMQNPVIPLSFDSEQKGMQSGDAVVDQEAARETWLAARDMAVAKADSLAALGVHKSLCNRIVEPWMWITVLITATEWKNFFRLRCHPAAEKHMQKIAYMMQNVLAVSVPKELIQGQWHLPYISQEDKNATVGSFEDWLQQLKMMAVGRCARLSYLTHEGKRDPASDIALASRLINNKDGVIHASPFEHVAQAMNSDIWSGCFRGWHQFRKEFAGENILG